MVDRDIEAICCVYSKIDWQGTTMAGKKVSRSQDKSETCSTYYLLATTSTTVVTVVRLHMFSILFLRVYTLTTPAIDV